MNWDDYFFSIVDTVSKKSKDSSTQVGCVIVGSGGNIISTGYNSFVRNINDGVEYRQSRPEKYYWMEHAERNAIYNAARSGVSLLNSTLYVSGIPCHDCWRGIIQSGIRTVVVSDIGSEYYIKNWSESCQRGLEMVRERNQYFDPVNATFLLFKNEVQNKSFEPPILDITLRDMYARTEKNINHIIKTFDETWKASTI